MTYMTNTGSKTNPLKALLTLKKDIECSLDMHNESVKTAEEHLKETKAVCNALNVDYINTMKAIALLESQGFMP